MQMNTPPTLPGRDAALFLDFDGTLVAIAETPEAVRVPEGMVPLLIELHDLLEGAVAVVSGRPIDVLDRFLAPLRLPTAGEHGAQRRDAEGGLHEQPPADLRRVLDEANALAARHTGLLVERKHAAVALHYRLAPQLESLCLDAMGAAVGTDPALELLHGKCVVEIKPAGVNKGIAIDAFLKEAPFAGRRPYFAGDDTTDESGFAVVQARGGLGYKVGEGSTRAQVRLASPRDVMAWLQAIRNALVPAQPDAARAVPAAS
ncbi:trehalose-phosphatase [Xenophilus sp. Marseille-Q4582]|uniref:trehalose-phosphatase n=1 Tax=Xenophilus sp. Marseille-Q4582 TaxID=2866600 RepID=UPI001CE46113|nr:trehalose-phosphatase [Xenophilus sp. Marseille-Q4582]